MLVALVITLLLGSCARDAIAQPEPEPILITEIDCDQPGSDTGEWIELHNPYDFEVQTAGVFLVLYDGDLSGTCTEYCRIDLSPLVVMPEGSYTIIGNHPCAVLPLCSSTDAIQNGPADGVAVIGPDEYLLDAVEYAAVLGGTACGFSQSYAGDRDTMAGSIIRCDPLWVNAFWIFSGASSPCGPNACTPTDVPAPPQWSWSTVKTLFR